MSRYAAHLSAFVLLFILIACSSASARIIYVKADSPGPTFDGTSWQTAYHIVQAAGIVAVSGDQIWVARGSYTAGVGLASGVALYGGFVGTETDLSQRPAFPRPVPDANETVLSGDLSGSVISANADAAGVVVDGLTIRRGYYGVDAASAAITVVNSTISGNNAAGVRCGDNSAIRSSSITSNGGGGIRCGSDCIVTNNTITGNAVANTGSGGGIDCQAYCQVHNNVIAANTAEYGGGIYAGFGSMITNNTILGNGAGVGGGLCTDDPLVAAANNIIAFNTSGIYGAGITLSNNCVYNPDGDNYVSVAPGATDINVDPQLVSADYGEFHLLPGSPCIGGGLNSAADSGWTDIDGNPRILSGTVDIGADEFDGTPHTHTPIVVRVKLNGDDAKDGSSWDNAKRTVQAALDAASALGGEVWVAAGTYSERIVLPPFVDLYGGFAGGETDNRFQRDPSANESVIDAGKAGSGITVRCAARHSVIDGLTIRNGHASYGGGIYSAYCSPVISNNRIAGSISINDGGGIYLEEGKPTVAGNTICDNKGSRGGGLACDADANVFGNSFLGNYGGLGGAVYIQYAAALHNNRIVGNGAGSGGGIYFWGPASVYSNLIAANAANSGGGLYIDSAYSSATSIVNNTITDNSASAKAGGVYCNSSAALANNIVAHNSSGVYLARDYYAVTLSHNCVHNPAGYDYSGLAQGPTDITSDPQLLAYDWGDVHLQPGSPCIGAGDNSAAYTGWTDMDGQLRIQNGQVDIGADEYDETPRSFEPTIVRVSPTGSDDNDGVSWTAAKGAVQSALDAACAGGGEVWVAEGTYNQRIYLRPYAHLYGGFAGSESARDQRDWSAHESILDGQQGGSVVTALAGGTRERIDGFTIRNGKARDWWEAGNSDYVGGGINCMSSSVTIANNHITGNSAPGSFGYGGGISCSSGAPSILDNVVSGNSGNCGGGISLRSTSATVSGCRITGNSAGFGGGVYCNGATVGLFRNTVEGNTATSGAGIYCTFQNTAQIANNLIVGNILNGYTSTGSAIYCSSAGQTSVVNNTITGNSGGTGAIGFGYAPMNIANNIIASNTAGIYCWGGVAPSVGNNCLSNAPGANYTGLTPPATDIVSGPHFVNSAFGDYHLKPNSPCINAGSNTAPGTPAQDMDGNSRIWAGIVDMGAYEFTAAPSSAAAAKSMSDGFWTCLSGQVVTAAFPGFFYVESNDRVSGIRVDMPDHGLTAGQRAEVSGKLQTNAHGERFIAAGSVTPVGFGSIAPLWMTAKSVGGSDWLYDPATGAGQRGTDLGRGLNNIGLLVRLSGVVTESGSDYFCVADGGTVMAPEPVVARVKVLWLTGVAMPLPGTRVSVTGVSSCEQVQGRLISILRVRSAQDIQ